MACLRPPLYTPRDRQSLGLNLRISKKMSPPRARSNPNCPEGFLTTFGMTIRGVRRERRWESPGTWQETNRTLEIEGCGTRSRRYYL